MTDSPRNLDDIRAGIDRIDRELMRLINERARLAQAAGEVKRARDGDDAPLYRPEREAQLLKHIASENPGPVESAQLQTIFKEVISGCRALEVPLSVAYFGPEGTYTEAAALKHFGNGVTTVPRPTIDEVFREVESGAANYGVVPVENSTEGMVSHTLDSFMDSPLKIAGYSHSIVAGGLLLMS